MAKRGSALPIVMLLASLVSMSCGGVSSSRTDTGGSGGQKGSVPPAPTTLAATAGNQQIDLTWSASSGATTYNVKRSTTTGGPYTQIVTTTVASDMDTSLTNGATYYYVVSAVNSVGESANSSQASATPTSTTGAVPAVPMGLAAAAGNQQVSLTWNASAGATSYNIKRGTVSSGPFTQMANTSGTNDTDAGVTNGTAYYYVVSALNATGESGNSNPVPATPAGSGSGSGVQATINVLENHHTISPYVYGGSYPANAAAITDSGLSVVRWGGNATSTYNWKLGTDNADNDWYFEDFNYSEIGDSDSVQYIKDVKSAGSAPLMTMVMLPWVAQSAETSQQQGGTNNFHWSFWLPSMARNAAPIPTTTTRVMVLERTAAPTSQETIRMTRISRFSMITRRFVLREPPANTAAIGPPRSRAPSGADPARFLILRSRPATFMTWTTKSISGAERIATFIPIHRATTSCRARI